MKKLSAPFGALFILPSPDVLVICYQQVILGVFFYDVESSDFIIVFPFHFITTLQQVYTSLTRFVDEHHLIRNRTIVTYSCVQQFHVIHDFTE